MDYIILDLEWNQSFEGKEHEVSEIPFEIIEIGAIKLNSQKEMIGEFSQLIKPQVYHQMNYMTKKIIHLQMEELKKGKLFSEVASEFLEWCGESYIFCTWGPVDITELQRNLRYYNMEPLSDRPIAFYDVQKLFSICYEDKKIRRSLEYAVDFLKIQKDIPFHRAFSDAYYTAKVFAQINSESVMEKVSFDSFYAPKSKEQEVHIVFEDYAKYISREFNDKTEAMNDREVTSSKCYICNKNLKKKLRWFTPNGKHYYSIAHCDVHGYLKCKIRMKRSDTDKVYVVKTLKFVNEDKVSIIKDKQEKSRVQRQLKRKTKSSE